MTTGHERALQRVFISYSRQDGEELATRLRNDLIRENVAVWLDIADVGGGESWTAAIEEAIDRSDVVLALLTPGSYRSEICRAEQLRSLRKSKCVIPVLAHPGAEIPLHFEGRQFRDFSANGSYRTTLAELLRDILQRHGAVLDERYRTTRVTYVTAPPMVVHFIERPQVLGAIRDLLFAPGEHSAIALTALEGMGGIGKTVLAQAICRDEIVQEAFPDGIVWITAGRDTKVDVLTQLREIGRALGDDLRSYNTPTAAAHQYRSTIARAAALIVIDDVWSRGDLDPYLAESPRSRFLFTTRDAAIARFTGARKHMLGLLDHAQSRELIARWARLPINQLPAEASEIINECGRLPLALSIVGALLADTGAETWRDTLELLREANLGGFAAQLPPGQDSFFRAVEVSVTALAPQLQDAYVALACLLEGMAAPMPVLRTLWRVTEAEARRISRILIDRSLAQPEHDVPGSIRLHDLQLDYLRARSRYREEMPLLRGALRLAAHIVSADGGQFASQMVGRLHPHRDSLNVGTFVNTIAAGAPRPWLRPLYDALAAPGGALVRTLRAHDEAIFMMSVATDGRRAVTVSEDGTVRFWDVESGAEVRRLDMIVKSVAISGNGERVGATLDQNTFVVWDWDTGRELFSSTDPSRSSSGVSLTANGRLAVTYGDDAIVVWDVDASSAVRTIVIGKRIRKANVSPDGRRAVAIAADGRAHLFDIANGTHLGMLQGRAQEIALNVDGSLAVSAADDGRLMFRAIGANRPVEGVESHLDVVHSVAVSSDGRVAASGSRDRVVRVWDTKTGQCVRAFDGHSGPITGVSISHDGRRVVSCSFDRTMKVWNVAGDPALRARPKHLKAINRIAVTPDGRRAVSASGDSSLKVWAVEYGEDVLTLMGHARAVNGVAITADGQWALSASGDRTLRLWEIDTGRTLRTFAGHEGYVLAVAADARGSRAVSGAADHTIRVWDIQRGNPLRTLEGHTGYVADLAMSSDGRIAVSASWDGTLKVWDIEAGRQLATLADHNGYVSAVTVSSAAELIVSASWDHTVKVWDRATTTLVRTLQGHSSWINAVALSPDAQFAASAGADHTIKVWDLIDGRAVASFTCDAVFGSCAFASNRLVLAGDVLGQLHFLALEL